MNERYSSANDPSPIPSSSLAPASQATGSGSIRPRNRRIELDTANRDRISSQSPDRRLNRLTALEPSQRSRSSPRPSRQHGASMDSRSDDAKIGQFLGDSWSQSWASVQGFASMLISTGNDKRNSPARPHSLSRASSRSGIWGRGSSNSNPNRPAKTWGPNPPTSNPGLSDVAAGSLAERDSALRAAKTASVLESHDGVNGRLDVSGRYKRRNSDETIPENSQPEDYLVYIHTVQTSDTYTGLILRYKCREDAFRRANGLWSRDSVQTRKWLTVPVDACEIRGRACDPPSWHDTYTADASTATPPTNNDLSINQQSEHDDFLGRKPSGKVKSGKDGPEEDNPWTHVRWVQIDGFSQPVEIGRVARQAMGYFPPRRKKSIVTASSLSTPRQSSEFSIAAPSSVERTRRQSSLNGHMRVPSTPTSSRSRAGSELADGLPIWMRRPGGVGTMSRNVRAPGPDKDYFNSWAGKHLPALNVEGVPSMSIMGSERAHFGFSGDVSGSGLVESPFGEQQDTTSTARNGTGLDRAAAVVETWLRGALARRPSTSLSGARSWSTGGGARRPLDTPDRGDLIELADTASDDGRPGSEAPLPSRLLSTSPMGSSSRSKMNGDGQFRGRLRQSHKVDEAD